MIGVVMNSDSAGRSTKVVFAAVKGRFTGGFPPCKLKYELVLGSKSELGKKAISCQSFLKPN